MIDYLFSNNAWACVKACARTTVIEEVWDKIGLQLVFDDPFERVQEK